MDVNNNYLLIDLIRNEINIPIVGKDSNNAVISRSWHPEFKISHNTKVVGDFNEILFIRVWDFNRGYFQASFVFVLF